MLDNFTWPQVVNALIGMTGTSIGLWIAYKTSQLKAKVDVVEVKVDGKIDALVKALEENVSLKELTARSSGEASGRADERARRDILDSRKVAARADAERLLVVEAAGDARILREEKKESATIATEVSADVHDALTEAAHASVQDLANEILPEEKSPHITLAPKVEPKK